MNLANISRGAWLSALILCAACNGSDVAQQQAALIGGPALTPANLVTCPKAAPADTMEMLPDAVTTYFTNMKWCTVVVPYYNDEQRFPGADNRYGAVAYAIAAPYLASFTRAQQFEENYVAVAVVYIPDGDVAHKPYTQLGLKQGFNCVYLKHSVTKPEWTAQIQLEAAGCNGVSPNAGTPLSVLAEITAGASAEDYPPVVRWVQLKDSTEALGVRCGAAWCDVGVETTGRLEPNAHAALSTTPMSPVKSKRWTIRGWFDDQHLAVPLAAGQTGNYGLRAGGQASLIPDEGLAGYTEKGDYEKRWVHAATVYFGDDPPAKYKQGYGFIKGTNEIAIFKGPDNVWIARITNASFVYGAFRAIRRVSHPGILIPATTRWRWSDRDDLVWVMCDGSCCYVEQGDN